MSQHNPYIEGYEAYEAGVPFTANPYTPPESAIASPLSDSVEWELGWFRAESDDTTPLHIKGLATKG